MDSLVKLKHLIARLTFGVNVICFFPAILIIGVELALVPTLRVGTVLGAICVLNQPE